MIRRLLELEWRALRLALRAALLPFTALLWRKERHLVWRLSEACFGADRPGVYPEIGLSDLLDRATTAHILELPRESYSVTELELLALAALTSFLRPRVVFEIGTADGRTTRNLAANVGAAGRVYTINLPLEEDSTHRQAVPVGFRFQGRIEAGRIVQFWGDSREFDFSPYFGRCQLVFIDADHSEEAVLADSKTALWLVDREAGLILWHDALRYGVQAALPLLMRQQSLPLGLIARTNLAMLCFAGGRAMAPEEWSREMALREVR